jgi:hypothetical protein
MAALHNSAPQTEWERTKSSWESSVPVEQKWNIFSRSFLVFMFPLLRKGYSSAKHGPLEREDLPGLATSLKMASAGSDIDQAWEREKRKKNPRLYRALIRASGSLLSLGTFFGLVQGLLSAVGRPLVLRVLVTGLQSESWGVNEAVGYIFLFGVVSFAEGWVGTMSRQKLAEQFGTR